MGANRLYVSTAHFHAPFSEVPFAGLGGLGDDELYKPNRWPPGRRYFDVSNFRAPYDEGYYQDNSLQGDAPNMVRNMNLSDRSPPDVRRFLNSGTPIAEWKRDVLVPFNQIHPWVYGGIGVVALGLSYLSYRKFKKEHGKGHSGA